MTLKHSPGDDPSIVNHTLGGGIIGVGADMAEHSLGLDVIDFTGLGLVAGLTVGVFKKVARALA